MPPQDKERPKEDGANAAEDSPSPVTPGVAGEVGKTVHEKVADILQGIMAASEEKVLPVSKTAEAASSPIILSPKNVDAEEAEIDAVVEEAVSATNPPRTRHPASHSRPLGKLSQRLPFAQHLEGPVGSKVATLARATTGGIVGWQVAGRFGSWLMRLWSDGVLVPSIGGSAALLSVPGWYGVRRLCARYFHDKRLCADINADSLLGRELDAAVSDRDRGVSKEKVLLWTALAKAGPLPIEVPTLVTDDRYARCVLRTADALATLALDANATPPGMSEDECRELLRRMKHLGKEHREALLRMGTRDVNHSPEDARFVSEVCAEYGRMLSFAHMRMRDRQTNWLAGSSAATTAFSAAAYGFPFVPIAAPLIGAAGYVAGRSWYREKVCKRELSIAPNGAGLLRQGRPIPSSEVFDYRSTLHQPDLLADYKKSEDVPENKRARVADLANRFMYPSQLAGFVPASVEALSEAWAPFAHFHASKWKPSAPAKDESKIAAARRNLNKCQENKHALVVSLGAAETQLTKVISSPEEKLAPLKVHVADLQKKVSEAGLLVEAAQDLFDQAERPQPPTEPYGGDAAGNDLDVCMAFAVAVNRKWEKFASEGKTPVTGLKKVGVSLQKSELAKAGGFAIAGGATVPLLAAKIPYISGVVAGLGPIGSWVTAAAGVYGGWWLYRQYRQYFSAKKE